MELRSLSFPIFLPSGDDAVRCIANVQDALRAMHGIHDASVNNARDTLRVVFDPERLTTSRIEQEARRAGADLALHIDHATFALPTLDSPEAALQLTRVLRGVAGILWAGVDFPSALLHLEYDRSVIDVDAVRARLLRLGISPRLLWRSDAEASPDLKSLAAMSGVSSWRARRLFGSLIAAVGGMAAMNGLGASGVTVGKVLFVLSITLSGWDALASASRLMRVRAAGHRLPLLLSLALSLALGLWGTAAALSLIAAGAELLRDIWLSGERGRVWTWLADLPSTVTLVREDAEVRVPVSEARVGERAIIGKNEVIPLDGVITHGSGTVNASPLFGADNQYDAAVGYPVFAGSRNESEALEIRVLRHFRETPLIFARHAFAEAMTQGSPAQKHAEERREKMAVLLLWCAVFIAFVPPFLTTNRTPETLPLWLMRGLALAATAWSGSVLLSGKMGKMGAALEVARRGVVLRAGGVWETLAHVKALVHSRTGVLTEGRPRVADVVSCGKLTGAEILALASSLETYTTHPLGRAICHEAGQHSTDAQFAVTSFDELPGRGVRGMVNGIPVMVGSPRWFMEEGIDLPRSIQDAMSEADAGGLTPVLVAGHNAVYGLIVLRDTPSPAATKMVQALRDAGVFMQMVLSGDTVRATETVAKTASIAEFESEQTPDEKARWIETLRKQYGAVAMIGDGASDRGALRTADLSLTVRAAENPAGLDAADVSVLNADVGTLAFLRRQAQQVQKTAARSLAVTLALKALALVGVLVFSLGPWVVFAAEAAAMLFAVRAGLSLASPAAAQAAAVVPSKTEKPMEETEAVLELVFVHDPAADEEPVPGYTYPRWEAFVVPFTGEPIRFGRKSAQSTLPLQISDEGMSRLHGEIRMENRRPVVVDLRSTNGIRRNGRTAECLIPAEKPIPLRFGDVLMIGRNTRIEVRPPGESAQVLQQLAAPQSSMQKSGTPVR
jgi:Zn2+/Cd2+-exporting ATPase